MGLSSFRFQTIASEGWSRSHTEPMAEHGASLGFIQVSSVTFRLEKAQRITWSLSLENLPPSADLTSTSEQATQTLQQWMRPIPNMYV